MILIVRDLVRSDAEFERGRISACKACTLSDVVVGKMCLIVRFWVEFQNPIRWIL